MKKDIYVKSGIRGEKRVQDVLQSFCAGRYMYDLLFRYFGIIEYICSMQIDFICVLDKYIYVIEVKNWNSITDYDMKKDEYHILIKKKSRHIPSPIQQNITHKKFLASFLQIEENNIVCLSVICTDDNSDKKYVKDRNPYKYSNCHVVRIDELKDTIMKYENEKYQVGVDYQQIWSKIERANWPNEGCYEEQHIKYYKKSKRIYNHREINKIFEYSILVCDKCENGHMILKEKEGEYFFACSNFPKKCQKRTVPFNEVDKYAVCSVEDSERLLYYMTLTEYENKIKIIERDLEKNKKILLSLENEIDEKKKILNDILLNPEYRMKEDYEKTIFENMEYRKSLILMKKEYEKQNQEITSLKSKLEENKKENAKLTELYDVIEKKILSYS